MFIVTYILSWYRCFYLLCVFDILSVLFFVGPPCMCMTFHHHYYYYYSQSRCYHRHRVPSGGQQLAARVPGRQESPGRQLAGIPACRSHSDVRSNPLRSRTNTPPHATGTGRHSDISHAGRDMVHLVKPNQDYLFSHSKANSPLWHQVRDKPISHSGEK